MNTATKQLQKLIKESGQNIAVDGIFGNQTRHAIENMQVPNWIKTAMKEIGTAEIHGKQHNDRVLEYHSVSGGFSTDEVPWCGSFVNWVMWKTKHGVIQDGSSYVVRYPARAKSWLNFGLSVDEPVIGAIAIKSRSGGGHVTFVLGRDEVTNKLYCLGGNQNDEVNIRLYPSDVFIDFRVPATYANSILPIYNLDSDGAGSEG